MPRPRSSLTNLAELLRELGRYDEAEPLYREALAIDEAALGRRHVDTAVAMNNLAALLSPPAATGEAEPLMREALEIDREMLGPEHPEIATIEGNLAQVLLNSGRAPEAEALLRDTLAMERAAGSPDAAFARQQPRVSSCSSAGRNAEAEPLLREALARSQRRARGRASDDGQDEEQPGGGAERTPGARRGGAAGPRRRWPFRRRRSAAGNADTALTINNLARGAARYRPRGRGRAAVRRGARRARRRGSGRSIRRPGWWPRTSPSSRDGAAEPVSSGGGRLSRPLRPPARRCQVPADAFPSGDEPMSISLYELTVPVFLRGLGPARRRCSRRGAAHAEAEGMAADGAVGGAAGAGHADAGGAGAAGERYREVRGGADRRGGELALRRRGEELRRPAGADRADAGVPRGGAAGGDRRRGQGETIAANIGRSAGDDRGARTMR